MEPHNELVRSGKAYCLADPGKEYAVYSLEGGSFVLDLSHVGGRKLIGRFYDPRTGRYLKPFSITGSEKVVLKKPDSRDWVLLLRHKP